MADRWEYRTIFFRWDAELGKWAVKLEGERMTSVEASLNRLGASGWELVAMYVEDYRLEPPSQYANGIRAVFKRRSTDEA